MSVGTFAAAQLLRFVPRVRLSRAVGKLCERPLPGAVANAATQIYSRAYGVNLNEAEPRTTSYRSFDDFFTRRLRRGARAIAETQIVSPSDGRLVSLGAIDQNSKITVKSRQYDVAELVGERAEATRYAGGSFGVVYLSPRDYHRVHSPVDGAITLVRSVPGDLYPVNSIGERYVPRLFVRNQRVAIIIDTEALGRVSVVMVGATIVGRISVSALPSESRVPPGRHEISPPLSVARGDEIGVFHLGSTAVLLVEPGVDLAAQLGPVVFGQAFTRS